MRKSLCFLLAMLMICGLFAGCNEKPAATTAATVPAAATSPAEPSAPEQPAELTEEEKAILQERRDKAEAYMRSMATIMWRAEETVEYYKGNTLLRIVEGRLYRGIPYTHAAGNAAGFLDFSTGQDEDIYSISGLTMDLLGRSDDKIRRVGNDCSGAVVVSWGQVASSFEFKNTQRMTTDNGFLRVGDYISNPADNTGSKGICSANGADVMFAAYAQLQKADAVVHRTKSYGHVMMVTAVHVEYNDQGQIDGNASYATFLHQTNGYLQKEVKAFDETYGEDVYQTYGIDDKKTFQQLFEGGYLPITCLEFIDPKATYPDPVVEDSLDNPTIDDLYAGEFTSNLFIAFVDVTIADGEGKVLQQARAFSDRSNIRTLSLSEFVDYPSRIVGQLDPEALAPGTYTCTYEVELINGYRTVIRQIEFTVE